jgi:hypothetical protein
MKNKYLMIVCLLMGTFSSASSAGELLIGAKVGLVDFDAPASDPAINGSVMIGKEIWDIGAADIGFEGEFTLSVIDGEIGTTDADFQSIGAYAFLRTAGPVYFIARMGMTNSEVNNTDDTDTSMGLGVGFSTGGLRWEVEYTQYEIETLDVDMISLGLLF